MGFVKFVSITNVIRISRYMIITRPIIKGKQFLVHAFQSQTEYFHSFCKRQEFLFAFILNHFRSHQYMFMSLDRQTLIKFNTHSSIP